MFVIRDVMHCKPGQVRPMVEKFVALSKLTGEIGLSGMRVMTDVSAERFWTVVAELEVPSLEAYANAMKQSMQHPKFKEIMQGYHDLVEDGRREIYQLEG